jgi:hypothetical protein
VRALAVVLVLGAAVAAAASAQAMRDPQSAAHRCAPGARHAIIGGKHACLRAGARCQRRFDAQYHRYGFHCHGARLTRNVPAPPAPPRADLALTVVDAPDPVQVGSELTFTVTVANAGPAPASRVVAGTEQLADELNGGSLAFVRADAPCRESLGVIACVFTNIPVGGNATATVVVRPTAAGTLSAPWNAAPSDTGPRTATSRITTSRSRRRWQR